MTGARFLSLLSAGCALVASSLPAQGSGASRSVFLAASEIGPSSEAASTNFRLAGTFGSGVVAPRATSAGFVVEGGFAASLGASTAGKPWVTGVAPLFTTLAGATRHTVHGTELALGTATTVTVGGVTSSVGTRSVDRVDVTLGKPARPGWQQLELRNGGGLSGLQRAVGVKPMLDLERPVHTSGAFPTTIACHGTQGDFVVWLLALGNGFPLPLPPFGWRFELDLATLIVVVVTPIVDASGTGRLALPRFPFARPIHFQGLVLTQNAGYRPGAFTNVVRL